MQSTLTRSIRQYGAELCIGVISTLIDIAVALTCTQTRDDGEVYNALRNDPETDQPPRVLSISLPLITCTLGSGQSGMRRFLASESV
jgi:hypothetical protein